MFEYAHACLTFFILLDFFIIDFIFLKQFQVHNKIEEKVQKFPIYFLPSHMPNLPHYQQPSPALYFPEKRENQMPA